MTTINDVYGGDYLKAEDIKGKEVPCVISGHTTQEFEENGKKKNKIVLSFQGTDKNLDLNQTNANMIGHYYGVTVESWVGKQIILFVEPVPFQGKVVDGVRVKVIQDSAGGVNTDPRETGQANAVAAMAKEEPFDADSIPF